MNDPRRSLALYGWPEEFVPMRDKSLLILLIEIAKLAPNKITFFLSGTDTSRQRTVSKSRTVARIIEEFGSFEMIVAERILNNDFRDSQNSFKFDIAKAELVLENDDSKLGEKETVLALKAVLSVFSPRYGFADVFDGITARYLPRGTGSPQLSRLDNLRAADLFDSRRRTHEHLNGKMHDVYALNLLSDAHMNWPVGGQSLKQWIEVGGRGELFRAKPGVTLWTLDGDIKLHVRDELFKLGCLIATV